MKKISIYVFVLALTSAIVARTIISADPFAYDEADYVYAAKKGIVANYLDAGAIPFSKFIEKGRSQGSQKNERTDLSAYIRSQDDITFYRHYHGPLYYYWLSIPLIAGPIDEAFLRWWSWGLLIVCMIVLSVLYTKAFPSKTNIGLICTLLMTALGSSYLLTVAQITPHAIYVITAISCLCILSLFLLKPTLPRLYATGATLAFAFLAIEYAALLFITVIVLIGLHHKSLSEALQKGIINLFARLLAVWFLVISILWIGGIVEVTLIRNYIFFAYFSLVRSADYGTLGMLDVWWGRISQSPVEFLLIIVAMFYALKQVHNKRYQPFLLYAALYLLTSISNRSISPTYISSFMVVGYILVGLALDSWSEQHRIPVYVFGGIILALCINYFLFFRGLQQPRQDLARQVLTQVDKAQGVVAIPRLFQPTIHLYNPDASVLSYDLKVDEPAALAKRCKDSLVSAFIFIGEDSAQIMQALRGNYYMRSVEPLVDSSRQLAFVTHLQPR